MSAIQIVITTSSYLSYERSLFLAEINDFPALSFFAVFKVSSWQFGCLQCLMDLQ